MSVLILSDLHLDVWREARRSPFENLDRSRFADLDALILAGDVANKGYKQWRLAVEELSTMIDPAKIHLLPGNHEYYGASLDREDKLQATAEAAGAHFAQKSRIDIADTRYLCCTLWTNMRFPSTSIDLNMSAAQGIMNDYRKIRIDAKGYRRANPRDTVDSHNNHLAWLRSELSEPWQGRTVVVTHHAPLPACTLTPDEPHASAYVSDLSDLIGEFEIDTWVSGHTHHSIDFDYSGTRFVSAHLGYPHQVKNAPTFEELGFHDPARTPEEEPGF